MNSGQPERSTCQRHGAFLFFSGAVPPIDIVICSLAAKLRAASQKGETCMPAAQLTAGEIKAKIQRMMIRNRYRCAEDELEALHEALRRVEQHERLIQEVVPDLRSRLGQWEAGRNQGCCGL
jgi:hypothetical protein